MCSFGFFGLAVVDGGCCQSDSILSLHQALRRSRIFTILSLTLILFSSSQNFRVIYPLDGLLIIKISFCQGASVPNEFDSLSLKVELKSSLWPVASNINIGKSSFGV